MNNKAFDRYLDEAVADLNTEIEPPKPLWPGIEKAIAHPELTHSSKPVHWQKYGALAACLCLCVLTFQLLKQPAGVESQDNMLVMNESFQQQKKALLVQYASQPAVTDNWQAQLADLEKAEQAIKKALEHDPQSTALLKMLGQVYQQQLNLINKVHKPRWQRI